MLESIGIKQGLSKFRLENKFVIALMRKLRVPRCTLLLHHHLGSRQKELLAHSCDDMPNLLTEEAGRLLQKAMTFDPFS